MISILTICRWRFVLILFWTPVFPKGSYIITGFSKLCLFSHLGDRLLVSSRMYKSEAIIHSWFHPIFRMNSGHPNGPELIEPDFWVLTNWGKPYRGPTRGKRDGFIRHILECENGNWMKKVVLAWMIKLASSVIGYTRREMNFRQFLDVICAINLRESGIASLPLGGP